VLGPSEAFGSLATFATVLLVGGWTWGAVPEPALLATASGSAFAAIAVGQLANAVACRSATRPAWRTGLAGNRLLRVALLVEAVVCVGLLAVPPVADLLGGTWPGPIGWVGAALTGVLVVLADAAHKAARGHVRARGAADAERAATRPCVRPGADRAAGPR
jgi:magnesium-transporting ATPase (P-type)